jgi:hypothetical protein
MKDGAEEDFVARRGTGTEWRTASHEEREGVTC